MYAPPIHLAKRPALPGEIFMGSENDEITQMFDSAKSGPEYMGKSAIKCDKVLFYPGGYPTVYGKHSDYVHIFRR